LSCLESFVVVVFVSLYLEKLQNSFNLYFDSSPQVAGVPRFRFGPPEDMPQTSSSHSDLGQLASQGGKSFLYFYLLFHGCLSTKIIIIHP